MAKCPKCGSPNVSISKEFVKKKGVGKRIYLGDGAFRYARYEKVYKNVASCWTCGHKYTPRSTSSSRKNSQTNKCSTINNKPISNYSPTSSNSNIKSNQNPLFVVLLWILGFLFIFPLPLTILILKPSFKINSKIKLVIIIVLWIIYVLCLYNNNSNENITSSEQCYNIENAMDINFDSISSNDIYILS